MELGGLTNFADPNVNYCKAISYRRKLKAATSKRGNGILRPFPVERPETGNAGTDSRPRNSVWVLFSVPGVRRPI